MTVPRNSLISLVFLVSLTFLHLPMTANTPNEPARESIKIGWASCEITPLKLPVIIAGQMHGAFPKGWKIL